MVVTQQVFQGINSFALVTIPMFILAGDLIILTPVLLPLALQLGIDPIHFGLIIVAGLAIGMITPPVAINVYVASSVMELPLERITRATIPYLLGLICVLLLVVYVPILAGWSGG